MNFVTIDFETANSSRSSICSIGIVEYQNGQIKNEYYQLVNPEEEFNPFNIEIHGIQEKDVRDSPTFLDLYEEIRFLVDGKFLIAHNAAFDMSVLRHACDKYKLDYPNFEHSCSYQISKKLIPNQINYRLNTISGLFDFTFEHHHALEDAKAAGHIINSLAKEKKAKDIKDLCKIARINHGMHFGNRYVGSTTQTKYKKNIYELKPRVDVFDETHPFFDKHFVFTGTLRSMSRVEATQIILDIGGHVQNNVTKKTAYVVIGIYDLSRFGDGFKSSKLKKTEEYLQLGQEIEVLAEDDFLKMIP